METKHNIIRRALEQAPGTQLPEGFCVRLMERLERESERRERRETWLLGTAGVLCLLAVIAGLAWYLWYEPGVGLHLPDHALHSPTYPRCPAWAPYNFPNRISRPKAGGCPCSTSLSPRRSSPSQGSTSACASAGTMPRKQTHTRTDKPGTPAAGRIPGLRNTPGRRSACTGPYRLPVRYRTANPPQRMDSDQQTADGGQWAEGCEQGAPVGCGHRTAGSE